MDRRQRSLEARIQKIKEEIAALGELRPGTLSRQYNVCGKASCHCKATPPKKHGPYYQVSFTWQGKSRSEFVRQKNLPEVRKQLRNYRRLRGLVERWVALGIELSRLKLEEARSGRPESERTQPRLRFSGEKGSEDLVFERGRNALSHGDTRT